MDLSCISCLVFAVPLCASVYVCLVFKKEVNPQNMFVNKSHELN